MTPAGRPIRWGAGPLSFALESDDPAVRRLAATVFQPWASHDENIPTHSWRVEPVAGNGSGPAWRVRSSAGMDVELPSAARAVTAVEYNAVAAIAESDGRDRARRPGRPGWTGSPARRARGGGQVDARVRALGARGHAARGRHGHPRCRHRRGPPRAAARVAAEAEPGAAGRCLLRAHHGRAVQRRNSGIAPLPSGGDRGAAALRRGAAPRHRAPGPAWQRHRPARHEPIAPAHALLALLPYTNLRSRGPLGDAIRMLAPLAERMPVFDLGRGPLDRMAAAVEDLAGLASRHEPRERRSAPEGRATRRTVKSARLRAAAAPPATSMALMVTRRCNMTCGHCSVESGPDVRGEPTERELLDRVHQAAAGGVRSINLTGGEPMLRPRTVLRLVRVARRLGVATSLTTNGSWGRTAARAMPGGPCPSARRPGLAGGQRRPLPRGVPGPGARGHDRPRGRGRRPAGPDQPRRPGVGRWAGAAGRTLRGVSPTRLRFYGLQAVGRARGLPARPWAAPSTASAPRAPCPAVTDDGRLTACNGPAYFAPGGSPLMVGSLREEPLRALLARHRQDPILDTIRTFGPARLRDELGALPGFESFPFRKPTSASATSAFTSRPMRRPWRRCARGSRSPGARPSAGPRGSSSRTAAGEAS